MTNTPKNDRSTRRPDCVTEIRIGNSVLVVSGYFKQDTTATAADKMLKVEKGDFIADGPSMEKGEMALQDTTATAADKMLKVLEAEAATQKSAI